MAYADLHMHSTASDGTCNPSLIPAKACQTDGLFALALTDHDSLNGLDAAAAACKDYNIDFVPGVEVTTKYNDRAVHMLGYFIDSQNKSFLGYLRNNKERRENRAFEMADRLHEAGFAVSSQDLKNAEGEPNRPMLARFLLEHGNVSTLDEAFAKYLNSNSPYYVEAIYPDTVEAIRMIHEAGGYAFIAHPARYKVVDLIPTFAKEGLNGLEAFHTLQTSEQSKELLELAKQLNIGVSGGSDWHGDEVHHATAGGCGLSKERYHEFLKTCNQI